MTAMTDEKNKEAALAEAPAKDGLLGSIRSIGREAEAGGRNGSFGDFVGRYAVVFVFLAMIAGFSIALSDTFFTTQNFTTIAGQQAVAGLIALALLTTLIAGDFDLSIGATLTIASTVVIGLQIDQGFSWPAAMAVALVIFARWDPVRAIFAALFFGAAGALGPSLQAVGITQGYYFFNAAPYILTLVIMILWAGSKASARDVPGELSITR